ncbi:hypothetical protein [Streptomyces sp. NPDC053560]|uniref:hypothetical protein n=1 Tax=Streptomyces sp. NPDC053560 TaxID=3365711 RepID=UPI0037D62232
MATALTGLAAGTTATAPAASAAPGACVQPETKDFYIKSKWVNQQVDPDDPTFAKYSVRIAACPDQAPSAWNITEAAKELSFEGTLFNKDIYGELKHISTTGNERVIDLTMKLKQCGPPHQVLGGPCADEVIFAKRFVLTEVGNEVQLKQSDFPTTGWGSSDKYVTELPQQ